MVKDDSELKSIRRAAAIVDAVYEALSHESIIGRTEVEVAQWLERMMREHGAQALAFDSIVAAGVNGSRPHADPADVAIEAGTLVTVDMGCVVDGYHSDCTRTFATGDLPAQLEEVYGLVAQAQLDGLAAVRAGAFGPDVDAASRVAIGAAGLAEAYGHGLGHGVGLDSNEAPALRPESTDTLAVGNVITVEPGLYLPGVGGCRIEDLVAVTEERVRDHLIVHQGAAGRRLTSNVRRRVRPTVPRRPPPQLRRPAASPQELLCAASSVGGHPHSRQQAPKPARATSSKATPADRVPAPPCRIRAARKTS